MLFFIFFIQISFIYEVNEFPENFSYYKQESRKYGIIFLSILFIFLEYYNLINKYNLDFLKKFIIFINSYMLVSIIIYWLFYK
jgi:hypothetical protein